MGDCKARRSSKMVQSIGRMIYAPCFYPSTDLYAVSDRVRVLRIVLIVLRTTRCKGQQQSAYEFDHFWTRSLFLRCAHLPKHTPPNGPVGLFPAAILFRTASSYHIGHHYCVYLAETVKSRIGTAAYHLVRVTGGSRVVRALCVCVSLARARSAPIPCAR